MTEDDLQTLAALADCIIPPSETYGVPGAGDPAITAEIASDAAKRMPELAEVLATLDAMAEGGAFASLAPADRAATAEAFRSACPAEAALIANLVAQCYYRDDRVTASLGLEDRPPHPTGYEVKDGDWSLLDSVRRRESFYRRAD